MFCPHSPELWLADVNRSLRGHDLFAQAVLLEHHMAQLEAWLDAHPEADEKWYALLEHIADHHAATLERIALLRHGGALEVAVRLPAWYRGPVGHSWTVLGNGEIIAWFTPEELETAAWASAALDHMVEETSCAA